MQTKLDLRSLNEVQMKAVTWPSSPLLVLAGPGSGKTRVLTMRAAWLLATSPEKRFRVLALTFTVKAANEMKERLLSLVGETARLRVSTFHAFAAEILRQHGSHVGLAPNFEIVSDESERHKLVAGVLEDLARDEDIFGQPRLGGLLDIYLERNWDTQTAAKALKDQKLAELLSTIAERYTSFLVERRILDFPTIIGLTIRLLKEFPGVARQIHTTYTHVLVDEFQDTNRAQFELLKCLVGTNSDNLFAVGDDDQIIYQWNGASPRRIDQLRNEYNATILQLPTNFRCPPEIVSLANSLIAHNASRTASKQPLVSAREASDGECVFAATFSSIDDELQWIASDIQSHSLSFDDVVLICRSNRLAKLAVEVLNAAGLPSAQPKRKSDFDNAGVRMLINLLKAWNSPTNDEHLERLAENVYALTGERLDLDGAREKALQADSFALKELIRTTIPDSASEAIRNVGRAAVEHLSDKLDVRAFITVGLDAVHSSFSPGNPMAAGELEAFKEDADILRTFANGWHREHSATGKASLASFLQELQLTPKVAPLPKNTILCLTVHTSKGLEFGHVYLFGMVEGQFPSYHSLKNGDVSAEMEEERRSCFVAITRASRRLVLTWSSSYFGYKYAPSRFLREMGLVA